MTALQAAIESVGAVEVAPGFYAQQEPDLSWHVSTDPVMRGAKLIAWRSSVAMPAWWRPNARFAWYAGNRRFTDGCPVVINGKRVKVTRITTADLATGEEVPA